MDTHRPTTIHAEAYPTRLLVSAPPARTGYPDEALGPVRVRYQAGDAVRLRVVADSGRRYSLKDARVETVSDCGRYLRVSGVLLRGKVRHEWDVLTGDVRRARRRVKA